MLMLDQLHLSEVGFDAKLEIQGPLNLLLGGSNTLQDPHTRGVHRQKGITSVPMLTKT